MKYLILIVSLYFFLPSSTYASFIVVKDHVYVDSYAGTSTFTIEFNQTPDFFTLDADDRQENSFQYYIYGDESLGYPDFYSAIIRGSELHVTVDKIRIRKASPSSGDASSGGWGAVIAEVPWQLNESTIFFTVNTSSLTSFLNEDGVFKYNLLLTEYGASSSYIEGRFSTTLSIPNVKTLWTPVRTGSDDAEENLNDGDVSLFSSDMELVQDGLKPQLVGLRFPLNIPAGATILNANIQFTADETSSVPTDLFLSAEATPHALTFEDLDYNISNRPLTAASIQWSPPEWDLKGEAGPNQETPDIAVILQEIINQVDWVLGNSIAIIISGDGMREAESFDGTAPPVLHVTFSTEPPNEDFYAIGDTGPGGGIVFYTTNKGLHGLEVSPENQGQALWGCFAETNPPAIIIGANLTGLATGKQNTDDILAACNESGIAAEIADLYDLNGVRNWYLPSIDESLLLYEQRALIGLNANFWTSTENSAYSAFYLRLSQGDTRTGNKEVFFDVWPIRAF